MCLLLFLICGKNVHAQLSAIHDFTRLKDIELVNEKGIPFRYSFAGGLNNCQIMNIDMDLDGVDDILVFDRHGNRLLPFLTNTLTSEQYTFAPELVDKFPPLSQWVQCIDYDRDGKKDLFTYTTGGIKVYHNTSFGKLSFEEVTHPYLLSQQGTTLTNILVTTADYPAILDLDGDGDLDILTFWGLGSFVEFHRNTSQERFGNSDSLTFEKTSSCWGHFAEGGESNAIKLDTCVNFTELKRAKNLPDDDPKHTGSTLLAHDWNGDGLIDLTIGDVDFSTLIQLTNGGTTSNAFMVSQTTDFPGTDHPVYMDSFPASMLVDIDNDGKKDLVVSPFEPSLNKARNINSVALYKNTGTEKKPVFEFITDSFLQNQMLDLGSGAYPVFFDYNGDGLTDILVGNYGRYDSCSFSNLNGLQCGYTSTITLLLNVGTKQKPAFRIADSNIAGLDALHMQSLIPALADIDGDGDLDLICGNSKGKLVYCENMALPGKPADFKLVDPAWFQIDAGDFSAPQLLDLDKDGLIDLAIGKKNGTISYYKNTGSAKSPLFTLVTDTLGGVHVTNTDLSNNGYCVPAFYTDKSGKTILFTGSEFGDISIYNQIDGNLQGSFTKLGVLPGVQEGWRTGIALGNLNNDTLVDMAIGNFAGGLALYSGSSDKIFGIDNPRLMHNQALLLSPNPARDKVMIHFADDVHQRFSNLIVMAADGKTALQIRNPQMPVQLDVSSLPNGLYLVVITSSLHVYSSKLIVNR